MEKFSEYTLQEKIHETRNSIIYRGKKENEANTVIIKVLKTKYPTPSEVARFKQEYSLVKNLNVDGIIKTYDLVKYHDAYAIIEEDFDGISLKELIKTKKINIIAFLQIALKLSDSLGILHKNNIIHLDIKPDNILINLKEGKVKITDFGISTVLTHSNDEIYNPDVIQGTLYYMSPEQTGRMNRSVDYRTDLYSLGIAFYEMLTGEVPFKSKDPMEIIHSHIARQPRPPKELNPAVPAVISDIIMKLLSKTPEERYQNSLGLKEDISACLNQIHQKGQIDEFPLGTKDISLKLNIPQIIVGREKELEILMEAFETAGKGSGEMILVLGHPGIGKSALINEIHKPIVARKGYFIFGKYEQLRKGVPYSSIIQAFQSLIRQIIAESEERITEWKEKLLSSLGPNGRVITSVIPELELIIGKQPEVPVLGPEESQNRFNLVFQNFINVFTAEDHPLAIFLDDIQWADLASLKLLKTIITNRDTKFLFLIGAYRDNEVSEYHSLSINIDEIQKSGKKVNKILLNPLEEKFINIMITKILRCEAEKSMPLTGLIHKKTGGNPFFVIQFLKTIYDNRILELNPQTGWEWDINKIEEMQVTGNVVEFMAGKISSLPKNTQDILKICACIGNRFDLESLSIVSGKSIEATLADLTSAINEDLVSLHGNAYKFHHDRIQEAAYSLMEDDEKTQLHYLIGKSVLQKTEEKYLYEKIFYIVDQINKGIRLVSDPDEKLKFAELNLMAGKKAKNSTAYASAAAYLKTGIELLPDDGWENHYQLAYSLHMERMECEYLTHVFNEAERIFQTIIDNANSNVDKANAYNTMVILYTSQGNYMEALKVGYEGLKMIGIKLPKKASNGMILMQLLRLYFTLGRRKIEDIINIPLTTDPEILAYHFLRNSINLVLYFIDANLYSYSVIGGAINVLKYGNYESSPFTLSALGSIIGSGIGLYDQGYRFGETALKLKEKIASVRNRCRIELAFAMMIQHWKGHAKYDLDYYREAYKHGLEEGDLLYSGHAINLLIMTRLMLGDNIDEILEEYGKYKDFLMGSKDPFVAHAYIEKTQQCLCLKGLTDERGRLNSGEFDEEKQIQYYREEKNLLGVYYLSLALISARYLFGKHSECLPFVFELDQLAEKKIAIGNLHIAEANFYSSLVLTSLYPDAGDGEKKKYEKIIKNNQKKMKIWADNCHENFLHKYLIIEAELAQLKGNLKLSLSLYDQAIKSAHENGYKQNEAIAYERAALLMLRTLNLERAGNYMKEAHYCYKRWGAEAKLKDIEEKYPELISNIMRNTSSLASVADTGSNSGSSSSGSRSLDLTTVIKTSQSLSGEIDLGKLLMNIMKLSIENAGAQRGFLILENKSDNKLYIEAAGRIEEAAEVLQSVPVEGNSSFSVSIVNYVNKTGENIVLSDASGDEQFINDPYINKNHPKSILCTPIRYKGITAGILYLENNLTTHAFTPERLELLQILSTQAAISIENSRLVALRENAAKLETEMKIAATIQSALLPDSPSIEGFDITVYMKPTSDVGGDYYDVINSGSKSWVIIGDVSGHGVPAGLVMMMVQTTIQALVRKYPDLKPSDLLSTVNEAIKYNMNKMNEDKYMTITAFSIGKDGKAVYSGLHQDIIVYRSSSGTVETTPSEGIWLSPWDMNQQNIDCELNLNPGDILLLFTDGITEARNKEGVMFSEEKLAEILKNSGRLRPNDIKDKILEDLQGYKKNDDVSLVILKKM